MNEWHPLTPRSWQVEAYKAWEEAKHAGTIEATTASGKTYLGMMVHYSFPDKKLLVVVPTIHLMYQWQLEFQKTFKEILNIDLDIGLVGDGKHEFNKNIVVAVVDSIRTADLTMFDIVILDEAHRYMSEVNKLFIQNHKFETLMALTATMERPDGLHKTFLESYPCVYKVSQKEGIEAGWLCKYTVYNMPCQLLPKEKDTYNVHDRFVKSNWFRYRSMGNVMAAMRRYDRNACDLMKAITKRRQILMNSATKIVHTANLIISNPNAKSIVFGEYKNAAEKLYKILQRHNISCAIYHSGLNTKLRDEMLEGFKNDVFRVIISVKCLDEGLNVPSAERAIIMGGSKVERQIIQRLGRVLRKQGDKQAVVIQLYVPDTKDEDWVRERTVPLKEAAEKIVWLKNTIMPENS